MLRRRPRELLWLMFTAAPRRHLDVPSSGQLTAWRLCSRPGSAFPARFACAGIPRRTALRGCISICQGLGVRVVELLLQEAAVRD